MREQKVPPRTVNQVSTKLGFWFLIRKIYRKQKWKTETRTQVARVKSAESKCSLIACRSKVVSSAAAAGPSLMISVWNILKGWSCTSSSSPPNDGKPGGKDEREDDRMKDGQRSDRSAPADVLKQFLISTRQRSCCSMVQTETQTAHVSARKLLHTVQHTRFVDHLEVLWPSAVWVVFRAGLGEK